MNGVAHRLGFAGTVLESARQTLVRMRGSRSRWFVFAVAAVLFAAAWVLGLRATARVDGQHLFCVLAWWVLGTVLMPWGTLYLGVQAIHGSLEDRTFQYLFLRPVGRVPLLLGNFVAVAVAGGVVAVVGTLALFAGIALHPERWSGGVDAGAAWACARTFAAGAVAYAAAAALFSAAFRRPLVWAAFFVVGLQQLTANLPVSAGLRRLTITDPMRRALLDAIEPDPRLAEALWPSEDFRLELVGAPMRDLLVLTAVTLALAAWAYRRSEYDSRLRE
jgi:hypothetical protein